MTNKIITRNIMCFLAFSCVLLCMQKQVDMSYNKFRRKKEATDGGNRKMSSNTGDNIKTLRRFYGETQEELGKSLNVSSVAISYFENNQRRPDIEMAKSIAQHYGVTMDQLVGSNFAAFRNIEAFPEATIDSGVLFKVTYPFADAATDNKSFRSGYQAAGRIVKSINSRIPMMESMIDHATCQFGKAIEETGLPEATVNYLLMLIIKWDSLRDEDKKTAEKEVISADPLIIDAEFMKKNYLGRDRSHSQGEAERKAKFIEKYGGQLIEKTKMLKKNKDWQDFAEFYQALRYLVDMVNINENSAEYNMNTGVEQMISLVVLGNKYAIDFISQPIRNIEYKADNNAGK